MTHIHYFPLSLGAAGIFLALVGGLAVLAAIGLLAHVSYALGLHPLTVTFILFASLVGSAVNVPLARLPGQTIVTREVVEIMGVPFLAPAAVNWPGTVLAINIGGAVIPILLSLYLLVRYELWTLGAVAVGIVAFFVHQMATPLPGVGIAVPRFTPPLLAAFVGLAVSRRFAAPLAYIGGSLGVLVGADLLNLGLLRNLGAPVASIGGAGTFDGVFLAGVIALVLASLVSA